MSQEWNVNPTNASEYAQACMEFVNDDTAFSNFKRDARYKKILEHVKRPESLMFINEMKDYEEVITPELLEKFKENDKYGNAEILEYDFFGSISPSTIRYIKNTLDVIAEFDTSKIKNIVEIGGGYGGLCKTLSCAIDFDNYVIIDLPEASALQEKYISKFENLNGKFRALPFTELDAIDGIDLVISNYAFSECSMDIQEKYYSDVVLNAKSFYMVYNNITPGNMNSTDYLLRASKDFNIEAETEVRPGHTNYIYFANKK